MKRQTSTDVSIGLKIKRDGEYVENAEGATDLGVLVTAAFVTESIGQATFEGEIILEDASGVIGTLNGSEIWELKLETTQKKATYLLRAYTIKDRVRSGNVEAYTVKCVSDEFLKNEVLTVFGNTKTLFNNKVEASEMITEMIEGKDYLNTRKRLHTEKTVNKHIFVASNWRIMDMIYWIAKRTVRAAGGGAKDEKQNGFLFWENIMGYHFKSIDKIIDDVNAMSYDSDSDMTEGKARLYEYTYSPKKSGDEDNDDYKIEGIVFPNDRDYLTGLRQGAWSGYSVGFDPNMFANGKISKDMLTATHAHEYDISEFWGKMSHVGKSTSKNPVETYDEDIKKLIQNPKRIRYDFLPNRMYDKPRWKVGSFSFGKKTEESKNYDEIPYLQSYQHLRVQSLKNVQLLVVIPGNLDLYSGYGVDIKIPKTKPVGSRIEIDYKYSGRYVISGLRHKYANQTLYTELMLCRDSVPIPK